jgi:hypothetical protein
LFVGGSTGPAGWFLTIKSWSDLTKDVATFLSTCYDAYEATKVDQKRAASEWSSWLPALGKLYEALSSVTDVKAAANIKSWSEAAFNTGKYFGGLKVDSLN